MAVFVTKAIETAVAEIPQPPTKTLQQIAMLKWYEVNQIAQFIVGIIPMAIAFDGANIWVAKGNGFATKLRASDGDNLGNFIGGGTNSTGIAFDGANIWMTNWTSASVSKLRASDGAVLGTFAVGTNPTGIAFDGVNIWMANEGSDFVSKL